MPALFEGIPWSTDQVLASSQEIAVREGWAVKMLPTCYDIDEVHDLARLVADPRCPPSLLDLLSGAL
jgi:glycosyltransferase A (GT-A) superfamily protein (DUF2064 family)